MENCASYSMVVSIILLLEISCPCLVNGDNHYIEPLNLGMKMNIPYDIANVFNRPIAGVLATILVVCMGCILFFGVISSPFGYMFGIPSRKYADALEGGEYNFF